VNGPDSVMSMIDYSRQNYGSDEKDVCVMESLVDHDKEATK